MLLFLRTFSNNNNNNNNKIIMHLYSASINTLLCNDICKHIIYNTYNVHNDRHNNKSEHKTTRINDSHYKLQSKKSP